MKERNFYSITAVFFVLAVIAVYGMGYAGVVSQTFVFCAGVVLSAAFALISAVFFVNVLYRVIADK